MDTATTARPRIQRQAMKSLSLDAEILAGQINQTPVLLEAVLEKLVPGHGARLATEICQLRGRRVLHSIAPVNVLGGSSCI